MMKMFLTKPVTPAIRAADTNSGGLENRMPARGGHDNSGCGGMLYAKFFVFLIALLCAVPAYAVTHPDERLEDPVLAARADNIGRQIRCVVCQNQSIYDSDTEIAQGLRTLIAVQLKEGKTDEEIIDYIHERYGDFVLMKPPVKPMTWGLWFGPILILLSGGLLAMRMMKIKKRRRRP